MTTERDHARDHAHDVPNHADLDVAPGRTNKSMQLRAPELPTPSGILRRKATGGASSADPEPAVAAASASTGQALPDSLRSRFETSLGTDLSSVRIHTGAESSHAASAVGARAYALGNDIHFAGGTYDPSSHGGQELIAHEVAHTVQQRGGSPSRQNKLEMSTPGDASEVEADRAAAAMVAGEAATISSAGTVGRKVQRKEGEEEAGSSNSYSSQSGLTWQNGTALQEDEVTQWKDKQASALTSAQTYVEICTGLKVTLGADTLIKKLESDIHSEYDADIRTREGEIEWLKEEIAAHDDKKESGMLWWKKTNAVEWNKSQEKQDQLRDAEAQLENQQNKRTSELGRCAKDAAKVVATVNGYVSNATKIGAGINAQTQALNPALFKDLSDGSAKVAMITSAVDFLATAGDRTALETFQKEPNYENAKAWSEQVGRVFQSAAGMAQGLPGGWGTVISSMMSMPAVVPAEFAKVLEDRYAKIDHETKDGSGKGEILDGGTSSKHKNDH